MLVVFIVGCEIAFWIALVLGLCVRYLLRRRRLGGVLLAAVPLIDVALLAATVVHLRRGEPADLTDGLAAVYLGFSVAFGPGLVQRMDTRFAHRFAGGPAPEPPPKYGAQRTAYEWRLFGKAAVAWAISCGLLLGGVLLVGGVDRGTALLAWIARITVVLLIWLIWPVSYSLWPAKPKAGKGS